MTVHLAAIIATRSTLYFVAIHLIFLTSGLNEHLIRIIRIKTGTTNYTNFTHKNGPEPIRGIREISG